MRTFVISAGGIFALAAAVGAGIYYGEATHPDTGEPVALYGCSSGTTGVRYFAAPPRATRCPTLVSCDPVADAALGCSPEGTIEIWEPCDRKWASATAEERERLTWTADVADAAATPERCTLASPTWLGSLRVWACICNGDECCKAPDDPAYLADEAAGLRALSKITDVGTLGPAEVLCARDPDGCGPGIPCNRPVWEIAAERRPPSTEWRPCNCWAAPYNGDCL